MEEMKLGPWLDLMNGFVGYAGQKEFRNSKHLSFLSQFFSLPSPSSIKHRKIIRLSMKNPTLSSIKTFPCSSKNIHKTIVHRLNFVWWIQIGDIQCKIGLFFLIRIRKKIYCTLLFAPIMLSIKGSMITFLMQYFPRNTITESLDFWLSITYGSEIMNKQMCYSIPFKWILGHNTTIKK